MLEIFIIVNENDKLKDQREGGGAIAKGKRWVGQK